MTPNLFLAQCIRETGALKAKGGKRTDKDAGLWFIVAHSLSSYLESVEQQSGEECQYLIVLNLRHYHRLSSPIVKIALGKTLRGCTWHQDGGFCSGVCNGFSISGCRFSKKNNIKVQTHPF